MLFDEFKSIMPIEKHDELCQWWDGINEREKIKLEIFHEYGEENETLRTNSISEYLTERDSVEADIDDLRDIASYAFPNQDYYENLIGNEVYLCARGPTFHICKAHKKLRAYLLLGILPKSFKCFIGKTGCAMQQQLGVGHNGLWAIKI